MRDYGLSPEPSGPPAWKLEPGTRWLYNIDGILWPIILLDEDFVDASEQHKISETTLPALQLGHHNFLWAQTAGLNEYDPLAARSNTFAAGRSEDGILSLAHSEALGSHNMFYWRGLLASERFARQFESGEIAQDLPSNIHAETGDRIVELPSEDSDDEDIGDGDIPPYTFEMSLADEGTRLTLGRSDQRFATILIGPAREPIVIPSAIVKANRHMSECVSIREAPDGGQSIVVSRRAFEEHKASVFKLIAMWMRLGQYRPRLDTRGRFQPSLRGDIRVQEMSKIGQVFDIAREMLVFEIFEYLWQRFQALRPWPPQSLLQLVAIVWRRAHVADEFEKLLRKDLIEAVARGYTDIVAEDNGSTLHDLFSRHAGFAKAVFTMRYATWVRDNPDETDDENEADEEEPGEDHADEDQADED